jgi:hypothetical protein
MKYIIIMQNRATPDLPTMVFNKNTTSRVFDESEVDEVLSELNTSYNEEGMFYHKLPYRELP